MNPGDAELLDLGRAALILTTNYHNRPGEVPVETFQACDERYRVAAFAAQMAFARHGLSPWDPAFTREDNMRRLHSAIANMNALLFEVEQREPAQPVNTVCPYCTNTNFVPMRPRGWFCWRCESSHPDMPDGPYVASGFANGE